MKRHIFYLSILSLFLFHCTPPLLPPSFSQEKQSFWEMVVELFKVEKKKEPLNPQEIKEKTDFLIYKSEYSRQSIDSLGNGDKWIRYSRHYFIFGYYCRSNPDDPMDSKRIPNIRFGKDEKENDPKNYAKVPDMKAKIYNTKEEVVHELPVFYRKGEFVYEDESGVYVTTKGHIYVHIPYSKDLTYILFLIHDKNGKELPVRDHYQDNDLITLRSSLTYINDDERISVGTYNEDIQCAGTYLVPMYYM